MPRTTPSPLSTPHNTRTTTGYYLYTPKPVTITPMGTTGLHEGGVVEGREEMESELEGKVSSLPRRIEWSNRCLFFILSLFGSLSLNLRFSRQSLTCPMHYSLSEALTQ